RAVLLENRGDEISDRPGVFDEEDRLGHEASVYQPSPVASSEEARNGGRTDVRRQDSAARGGPSSNRRRRATWRGSAATHHRSGVGWSSATSAGVRISSSKAIARTPECSGDASSGS